MHSEPSLFERGVRRVAEQRLREAMKAGKFDGLTGAGQPIPDVDEPFDEMWWIRRWVKREKLSQPRLQRELRDDRSRS